jgi:hypothetical protein
LSYRPAQPVLVLLADNSLKAAYASTYP